MANPTIGGFCTDTATPPHRLTATFTVTVKAITATSGGVEVIIATRNFTSMQGIYSIGPNGYSDTPSNNQFFVEFNRLTTPATIKRVGPNPWNVTPCTISPQVA
jgi:hypothetical protein